MAGRQRPEPFLTPQCCAGFLDPNPRDFSNCTASMKTEVKVKPRSRDTRQALPWGGVVVSAGRRRIWVPGLQLGHNAAGLSKQEAAFVGKKLFLLSFGGEGGGWRVRKSVP